ncbi:MAG: thiamine-phosphate kinase [Thermodesulfovibrionales bacterium]|nr:thiamine-phosphate kinase [Thermodesulfovibrionales bacterium]
MKLSQIGELSLLEQIRKRFEEHSRHIIVGIGDDAAVLKPVDKNLLLTADMMVEGVHFDLNFITPYQLGFKLISVNVSDIYAMGGKPGFLLLNIAMSKNTEKEVLDRFLDGIHGAMKLYTVSLVGGDLSSSNKGMTLSATLIGYTKRYIKRSGAKIGNRIYVTGNLGDSACGLELLKKIRRTVPLQRNRSTFNVQRLTENSEILTFNSKLSELGLSWNDVEPLLRRHLLPEARDSKEFVRNATSMIDISDGLLIDLSRLCDESKVGARIYIKNIPMSSELKKTASYLGIPPIKLALSGGEDYELLFTTPAEKKVKAIYIGDITESEKIIIHTLGRKKTFSAEGYQHFDVQG